MLSGGEKEKKARRPARPLPELGARPQMSSTPANRGAPWFGNCANKARNTFRNPEPELDEAAQQAAPRVGTLLGNGTFVSVNSAAWRRSRLFCSLLVFVCRRYMRAQLTNSSPVLTGRAVRTRCCSDLPV